MTLEIILIIIWCCKWQYRYLDSSRSTGGD